MSNINFENSDLGLSSALLARGHELVRVDKENPRRAIFIFADSGSIQEDIDDYWNDKLLISALKYFDSTKRLKTRLYS